MADNNTAKNSTSKASVSKPDTKPWAKITDKLSNVVTKLKSTVDGLVSRVSSLEKVVKGLRTRVTRVENAHPRRLLDLAHLWRLVCLDNGCDALSKELTFDTAFISQCKDWAQIVLVGGDKDGHWKRALPWFVVEDLKHTSRKAVFESLLYLSRAGSSDTARIVGEAERGFLKSNRSCRNFMMEVAKDLISQSDDELDDSTLRLLGWYRPPLEEVDADEPEVEWRLSALHHAYHLYLTNSYMVPNPYFLVNKSRHQYLWFEENVVPSFGVEPLTVKRLREKYSANNALELFQKIAEQWTTKWEDFKKYLFSGDPIEPKDFDTDFRLAYPYETIKGLTADDLLRLPRKASNLANELRSIIKDLDEIQSYIDPSKVKPHESDIPAIPDNIHDIWLYTFSHVLDERLDAAIRKGSSSSWGRNTRALLRLRKATAHRQSDLIRTFLSELQRLRITDMNLTDGRCTSINPSSSVYETGLDTHEKRFDFLHQAYKDGIWDDLSWLKKIYATCRLLTVPKDADKRRTITPMSLVQKAVDTPVSEALRNALEAVYPESFCFHDQTVQWDRLSCGWSTFDASSASDLINVFEVVASYPRIWKTLVATRPRYVEVHKVVIPLYMNSPMGAPQTFPVESGCFKFNMYPRRCTVYGDDVTSESTKELTMEDVYDRYDSLGWKLNVDKSFCHSDTAEACGCYRIGDDLFTILRAPRGHDEYVTEDNLRSYTAHNHNLFHYGKMRAAKYLGDCLLNVGITAGHTQYEVWTDNAVATVTESGNVVQTRLRKDRVKALTKDQEYKAEQICEYISRSSDPNYISEYIFLNSDFQPSSIMHKIEEQDDKVKVDRTEIEGIDFDLSQGIDKRALFATTSVRLENVEFEKIYDLYGGEFVIVNDGYTINR